MLSSFKKALKPPSRKNANDEKKSLDKGNTAPLNTTHSSESESLMTNTTILPAPTSARMTTSEFQSLVNDVHRKPGHPSKAFAAPPKPIEQPLSAVDPEVEAALNPDDPEIKQAIDTAKDTGEFRPLLQLLKEADVDRTRCVAAALRALTKKPEGLHRARLAVVDGVEPIVQMLRSDDDVVAEHSVTTLMNLSLVDAVKGYVFKSDDGLPGIVNLLENGSQTAKENAAATLFLLADSLERQEKIGKANAIPLLLEMLREGSLRGKKDACLALFNLSLSPRCRKEVVQEGGVEVLMELAQDAAMEEKSIAILANLAKVPEGCEDIIEQDGISFLVEILDMGTVRSREDATSVLLLLAQKDAKTALAIDKEGARGGLIKLAQSGTARGKKKAQELVEIIRKNKEEKM